MVKKMCRWLCGYYQIIITNNAKRLMDLIVANSIPVWDVVNNGSGYIFKISKKDYDAITRYIKKTESSVEITVKKGLFVWIAKSKKRIIFILGLICFFLIIYAYNLYLWDIEIVSDEAFPSDTIKKNIVNNYISVGTKKDKIDCNMIEESLRKDYPNIAWISCDICGTTLRVNLKETIEPVKIESGASPRNIIAGRDCIICDSVVRAGCILCEKGKEVKKGDILITGVVNIYNEYEELEDTSYVCADGDVYGVYDIEYENSFEMSYTRKTVEGKYRHRYYVKVFDKVLFKPHKINGSIVEQERKVKIGNTYSLPISIYVVDASKYNMTSGKYTKKQADEKAEKIINLYIENLRKKGVEILQNNVKIYFENDKCIMKGTIKVKGLVGVPSKLEIIDEQGEGL